MTLTEEEALARGATQQREADACKRLLTLATITIVNQYLHLTDAAHLAPPTFAYKGHTYSVECREVQ